MERLKVFLSYSWNDKDIADVIDKDFSCVGIKLIRDIRDLKYLGSIRDFVPTKRKADYSICIISDTFLKSLNCMWEMMDLWKKDVFDEQICPIIKDASIFDDDLIVNYIKYWEQECKNINTKMDSVSNMNRMGFNDDLEKCTLVSMYISQFLHSLKGKKNVMYSEIEKEGLRAYSTTIFIRIGIQPSDNIEILSQLSEQNNVAEFEMQAERYLNDVIVNPSELFLFTRASTSDIK